MLRARTITFGPKTNAFVKGFLMNKTVSFKPIQNGPFLKPMSFAGFHTSKVMFFKRADLPAMKISELKTLAVKNDVDITGLNREQIVEELSAYAEDAEIEEGEDAMDNVSVKYWEDVLAKAKTMRPPPPEKLSLELFDTAKNEAEAIIIGKAIINDLGLTDTEILVEDELMAQLDAKMDNNELEDMDDDEFTKIRKALVKQITSQVHEGKGDALASLVTLVQAPVEDVEGGAASWLKGHMLEIALTTLLDLRPSFDTDEKEWDEELFLEKVNNELEHLKVKFSYDPNYDWDDESGAPLTIHMESTTGEHLGSETYTFPDPTQFDQPDLMVPINKLLATKGYKWLDASHFEDMAPAYTWVLLPAETADHILKRYGPLTEWYKQFPEIDEEFEEGEEGLEQEEEEEEPEPQPTKRLSPPKRK